MSERASVAVVAVSSMALVEGDATREPLTVGRGREREERGGAGRKFRDDTDRRLGYIRRTECVRHSCSDICSYLVKVSAIVHKPRPGTPNAGLTESRNPEP